MAMSRPWWMMATRRQMSVASGRMWVLAARVVRAEAR
jgi:hypothetical protein